MGKLFDIDTKFMQGAMKVSDLLIINVLTVLCCLPVITIGPAFTAMHYSLLKLYRDEGSGAIKTFFHSFVTNLGQGILLTLAYMIFFGILALNYRFGSNSEGVLRLVLYPSLFFAFVGGLSLSWVFALLARYRNTVIGTIKTSLAAAIAHPIKTLLMAALMLCPYLILLLTAWGVPILLTFGLSGCGYLRVMLYDPIFQKLEQPVEAEENTQSNDDLEN